MTDELNERPLGLLDMMTSSRVMPERWPRTVLGWAELLRDSLITDVFRRCSWRGCWKRKTYTNLLGIGMCSAHFTEWYSPLPPETP